MYEDKVLVVKNFVSTGRWGLPGGGLHRGEDPRKGALREVFEETGVKLESSQLVYLFDRRTREAGIDVPNKFYYAELLNMSTPHKQWLEIIDAKWLPLKEFDKRNSDAALRLAIAAKENRR
jgi:ADP-ribose pyrophosphatase YjhB (NUDIX family)